MSKTVVGLFDRFEDAQRAAQDLIDSGINRNEISLVANDARGEFKNYRAADRSGIGDFDTPDSTGGTEGAEGATAGAVGGGVLGGVLGLLIGVGALAIPGIGPVLAAGPLAAALGTAGATAAVGAGLGAASGGLIGGLVGLGIPDEDANFYAEGVRRGGALLAVRTSDDMADRAADIMARYNVVDVDERSAEWRQSGWSRFDESAKPYRMEEIESFRSARPAGMTSRTETRSRDLDQGEAVLPVVEEELQVGKRQVQGGGARVHTKIEERPVEEQVHLREERVKVERRPVDRPASDADMNAFKETSFEVTETSEEPVVSKRARVIEEVVIGKEVQERTETVRDTVRRQDVHVHEQGTERAVGASGYDAFDADFRKYHQTNFANSGYSYDAYSPIYRYGYSLGTDQRYGGDWSTVEPEARRRWEERNPGSWEEFKDSIRYAWDRARGAR